MKLAGQAIRTKPCSRNASTSANSGETQYHVSKRVVHIVVPALLATYAILRFTDPSLSPQPPQKRIEQLQDSSCKKIHASDLNEYIKSHPDEILDEHTVGWNKMYHSFKNHRKNEAEPHRIEEENARLLAEYARKEENKYRSTKEEGAMSTLSGNTNIGHRPELVNEKDAVQNPGFSDNIATRVTEARRRLTKATKGFF